MQLPDDIFTKLADCEIFSQIDLSNAFLQMEVDEQIRSTVMQRIQDFGFTVQVGKCTFCLQQIRYLGDIVDNHGLLHGYGQDRDNIHVANSNL